MTLTLIGRPARPTPAHARSADSDDARAAVHGATLLAVLRDVVAAAADLDPDMLHSTLPAGRAVLTLSAAARAHVAGLGHDAGTTLTDGPGIVVLRDLVRALDLLERTAGSPSSLHAPSTTLAEEVVGAYRAFLDAA